MKIYKYLCSLGTIFDFFVFLLLSQTVLYFIVGEPGCGKTTTINWLRKKLPSLQKLHYKCPCIGDMYSHIYLPGRYEQFHGKSKKEHGDGTDRLGIGYESRDLNDLLQKLCKFNSLVVCEGISTMLANAPFMKKAEALGYKIVIREPNTPHDIISSQRLERDGNCKDLDKKIKRWNTARMKIDNEWKIVQDYQGHIVHEIIHICSQNYLRNIRSGNPNERYESYLLSVTEAILKSLKVTTQTTDKDHLTKKWLFQFLIGRTMTRFKQSSEEYIENPTKLNSYIRVSKVIERKNLPQKKKDLYDISVKILMHYNRNWAGEDQDFILQVSCMDKDYFVTEHIHASDTTTQIVITFGNYKGGMLNTFCPKKNQFKAVQTLGTMKEIDGRLPHFVSPVTDGKRYSLVFFKTYDSELM